MKLKINALDVWGNTEDGFEVNNVLGCIGEIEADITDDSDIIEALIDAEILTNGEYAFDDFGDDRGIIGNVIDPETLEPICQVKQVA